ncbi:MAG: thioesterase family protein [Acidimicrobiales bacterium]
MSFADAIATEPDGPNRWRSDIRPGWDIGGNANGGYLLAVAGRAMATQAERPDVATVTAHYLRPGPEGPVSIETDVVKTGRQFTTVNATLTSDKPILAVLGSFTDHGATSDARTILVEPEPEFPGPDDCIKVLPTETFPPPIMGKVDLRLHPDDDFYNTPSGSPQMRGWVNLLDGEEWDTFGLLLAADIFPPTIFNADFGIAWVPTLELTVHVRNRPAPGWLKGHFSSRFVTGGFVEEDGLIWDSRGTLVAQSRQISLLPRS